MQAEETVRPHEAHWFRAGEWLTAAIRHAKAASDQPTRLQALHIKRLICLFETALRRLILLAALTIELERTQPTRRRSPHHDKAVRRSGARRTPIRLYAFGQRASHAHAAGSTASAASPEQSHEQSPRKPRFHIGQSDSLTQGSAPARGSHTSRPHREATGPRENLDIDEPPPELLPPELRLAVGSTTQTAAPAAPAAPHTDPVAATPAAPRVAMTKQQLLEYLFALSLLLANPHAAIRRAARALARNQQLAQQIARLDFIKPKGAMRFSLHDYARVLLPLHTELRRAATERIHDSS